MISTGTWTTLSTTPFLTLSSTFTWSGTSDWTSGALPSHQEDTWLPTPARSMVALSTLRSTWRDSRWRKLGRAQVEQSWFAKSKHRKYHVQFSIDWVYFLWYMQRGQFGWTSWWGTAVMILCWTRSMRRPWSLAVLSMSWSILSAGNLSGYLTCGETSWSLYSLDIVVIDFIVNKLMGI